MFQLVKILKHSDSMFAVEGYRKIVSHHYVHYLSIILSVRGYFKHGLFLALFPVGDEAPGLLEKSSVIAVSLCWTGTMGAEGNLDQNNPSLSTGVGGHRQLLCTARGNTAFLLAHFCAACPSCAGSYLNGVFALYSLNLVSL